MKWRLSVHGAIVVMAIGVSSVAVAQPRANDGTTLGQLASIQVATERTAGFKQSLFTGAANRPIPAMSVANVVTVREAWESGAWSWSASKRRSFINDRAVVSVLALCLEQVRRNAATKILLVGCRVQVQISVPI